MVDITKWENRGAARLKYSANKKFLTDANPIGGLFSFFSFLFFSFMDSAVFHNRIRSSGEYDSLYSSYYFPDGDTVMDERREYLFTGEIGREAYLEEKAYDIICYLRKNRKNIHCFLDVLLIFRKELECKDIHYIQNVKEDYLLIYSKTSPFENGTTRFFCKIQLQALKDLIAQNNKKR